MLNLSDNKRRLRETLEKQQGERNLNINDFIIGDDGCLELAKFLQANPDYEVIEIKGNNISGKGFATICSALQNSQTLRRLSAEWNIIGSDRQGLDALRKLLHTCNNLTSVDLRNNKINYDGARILADIILECEFLTELDVRWNEFGILGGQVILDALVKNNTMLALDLKCNKLTQDLIMAVDGLLRRNQRVLNDRRARERERLESTRKEMEQAAATANATATATATEKGGMKANSSEKANPGSGEESRTRKGFFNTETQNFLSSKQEESDLNDIQSLLVRERARHKQLKLLAEQDLEAERRNRIDLEDIIIKLKENMIHKDQVISDLQFKLNNASSEITAASAEVTALKKEIDIIREQSANIKGDLERQVIFLQRELESLSHSHKKEVKDLLIENENFLDSVVSQWQDRCSSLEEKYQQLRVAKDETEQIGKELGEKLALNKFQYEEQIRTTIIRIKEEERRKYEQAFEHLEQKLRKNEGKKSGSDNMKLNKELESTEKGNFERVLNLENENQRLKRELNDIFQNIDRLEGFNKNIRNENGELLRELEKIRAENENLRISSERHINLLEEKFEKIAKEFDIDRMRGADDLKRCEMRNAELERIISEKDSQITKLHGELERLQESLHLNLNKTLAQTFYEHQSFEGTNSSLANLLGQRKLFY